MEKELQHKKISYIVSTILAIVSMIVVLYVSMPSIYNYIIAFSVGVQEGIGTMLVISNIVRLIKIYRKETV